MKQKNEKQAVQAGAPTVEIEESCGNIFEDMGLPDANELLFKAQLILEIRNILKARQYTQKQAAEITGMDQPTLSKLLRGRFIRCSSDKLFEMLNRLGHSVQVVIEPQEDKKATTFIRTGAQPVAPRSPVVQPKARTAAMPKKRVPA